MIQYPMEQFSLTSKLWSWFGSEFRVTSPEGQLKAYVKQKIFVLKEEVTVFEDEARTKPLLKIIARNVIDFNGIFDVFLIRTKRKLISFQRRGFASVLRDEWWVLDEDDRRVATVSEDSLQLALLRRVLGNLIPQTYMVTKDDSSIATLKQQFHLFRYAVTVSYDPTLFSYESTLALAVLLASIEGKQQS